MYLNKRWLTPKSCRQFQSRLKTSDRPVLKNKRKIFKIQSLISVADNKKNKRRAHKIVCYWEVVKIGVWRKLKNSVPSILHKPSMDKFIKYFETNYMNGCFAGMWNHYETEGPKTNNHIEAYNLYLIHTVFSFIRL